MGSFQKHSNENKQERNMCTYKQFFDFLWNFTIFDQKKCARATRQLILLIAIFNIISGLVAVNASPVEIGESETEYPSEVEYETIPEYEPITNETDIPPPECIDIPKFADCKKITTPLSYNFDSYCNDFYWYSKFCCKSCTEGGFPLHQDFLKLMGEEFMEKYHVKEEYREGYVAPIEYSVEYENEYEYY